MIEDLIITPSMVEQMTAHYAQNPADAKIINPEKMSLEVVDRFYGDHAQIGADLPWSKTHGNIKLRPGEVSVWAGVNGHGKSRSVSRCKQDDDRTWHGWRDRHYTSIDIGSNGCVT